MKFAYSLSGNKMLVRRYQVNATFANAGVVALDPGADNAGVAISTTTSFADAVGVSLDTATYVTAQQTDGTSAERKISIILQPDAVYRATLSGGATENTALTLYPVTTLSSDGLAVTTATDWTSPEWDEGSVWGYDGANLGQIRKVTSTSSTAATVTVPFDYDTVVGDNFLRAPYNPLQTLTLQTTTNLYQADASIAVGTGGAVRVIDIIHRDISNEGRTKSEVLFILGDHALGETT